VCFVAVTKGHEERTGAVDDSSGFSIRNRYEAEQVRLCAIESCIRSSPSVESLNT